MFLLFFNSTGDSVSPQNHCSSSLEYRGIKKLILYGIQVIRYFFEHLILVTALKFIVVKDLQSRTFVFFHLAPYSDLI